MIGILQGLLLALSIKVSLFLLTYGLELIEINEKISQLLKPLAHLTWLGDSYGIIIIVASTIVSILYVKRTPLVLKETYQRRIPTRMVTLVASYLIFTLIASSSNSPQNPLVEEGKIVKETGSQSIFSEPSFLWILNLNYPDTVGYALGFPINLLATLCLILYCTYAIILGLKRKSIAASTHCTAAIVFVLLNYNSPSSFFLFWTVQNISLILQAKKLKTINEPKQ
jgi:hypothetical protein